MIFLDKNLNYLITLLWSFYLILEEPIMSKYQEKQVTEILDWSRIKKSSNFFTFSSIQNE